MEFISTEIPDIILIKPELFNDDRGYFMESYHFIKYKNNGIDKVFIQDNHALSFKNTLRGLHFQNKYPQAKLVRCLQGKIFDVAVDIRKTSPNYGKWIGKELSDENKYQLYVPEGFAHGYYVISETAEVVYKCSDIYHPEDDNGIYWNDPDIGIDWPTKRPNLSDKDTKLPMLKTLVDIDCK